MTFARRVSFVAPWSAQIGAITEPEVRRTKFNHLPRKSVAPLVSAAPAAPRQQSPPGNALEIKKLEIF
jgi:hypothetical protein